MNDPRGSIWRKWDLHVHSPASHGFSGSWEQFFNQLKEAGCSVIGINDYFSVEGYAKVKQKIDSGDLDLENKAILPVVEFRMRDVLQNRHTSRSGTNINFHVIFDPDIGVEKMRTFLKGLEVEDGSQIADRYDNDAQFLKEKVKVYFEKDVIKKLRNNKNFKGRFLVWLPYDEYGGIGDIDPKTNDWIKRDFIKKSHILGSSDQKQIDFFLWKSPLDEEGNKKFKEGEFKRWFDVKKPCIKGSDSHKHDYPLGKLKNENSEPSEKFCWIKADPTFEGLRQIIYEPTERVKIQDSNPKNDYKKTVVSSLNIDNSLEFPIPDQEVKFNRNMVSIIGGRGSGKSVLLKSITHFNRLGGEFIEDICRDGGSAKFEMNLLNKDGVSENVRSETHSDDPHNLPIFYIPQNTLVNEAKNEDKVRSNILKHIGLADVLVKYSDLIEQAESLHSHLVGKEVAKQEIYEKLNYDLKEHGDFNAFINKKIENAKEKKKRYSTEKTQQLIEDITSILSEGQLLKKWKESGEFDEILAKIKANNRLINFYNKKIDAINKKSGVKLAKLPLLDLTGIQEKNKKNRSDAEARLKVLRASFAKKKKELEATGIKEDVTNLTDALNDIEKEITTLNHYKDSHDDLNREIDSLRDLLSRLFKNGDKGGDNSIPTRMKKTKSHIDKLFESFIKERGDSELFETMFKGVRVQGQIKFEWRKLKKSLRECFYKDAPVDVEKIIFGSKKISQDNFVSWIATEKIWKAIDKHAKHFKEEYARKNQLDGKNALISFVFEKWYEFIRVIPRIEAKYKGKFKELSKMSIGEQSTLLLKFKLATEGLKSQIIILDQPEDNLDNDFITNELENLMKEMKKHKQLIIATHNANLVVGADSEEVIVARLDQELRANKNYLSGSIENPRIRNEIITILEGGKEAFEKRRKKLQLQNET